MLQLVRFPDWAKRGLSSFFVGSLAALVAGAFFWIIDFVSPHLGFGSTDFLRDLLSVSDPVAFYVLLLVWVFVAALAQLHPVFQSAQASLAEGMILVMGYLFAVGVALLLISRFAPAVLATASSPIVYQLSFIAVVAIALAWSSARINSTSFGNVFVRLLISCCVAVVLLVVRTTFPSS